MAEITSLHADARTTKGTRPVRRLRAQGYVPAVVYGMGDPVPITVAWKELRAALTTGQGLNAVIHLELDGSSTPTLVKDLQRHPVRRDVLHIDFIRVDLDKPVDAEVSISLEGEAEAVTQEDGVIDQVLQSLLITAKPADIPSGLTIDIAGMTIGDTLRVSDITLPAGVTTPVDLDDPVVTASHGISEEELEAAEAEVAGDVDQPEVAEEAEGEVAEGEAEAGDGEAAAEGEGGESTDES